MTFGHWAPLSSKLSTKFSSWFLRVPPQFPGIKSMALLFMFTSSDRLMLSNLQLFRRKALPSFPVPSLPSHRPHSVTLSFPGSCYAARPASPQWCLLPQTFHPGEPHSVGKGLVCVHQWADHLIQDTLSDEDSLQRATLLPLWRKLHHAIVVYHSLAIRHGGDLGHLDRVKAEKARGNGTIGNFQATWSSYEYESPVDKMAWSPAYAMLRRSSFTK